MFGYFDFVFNFTFTIELIIKLFGLGCKIYAEDRFNLFDAFIVLLSNIDIILHITVLNGKSDEGNLMRLMKALRLLRVFKLSHVWHHFKKILYHIM